MAITESALLDALKTVIDPNTGKDFVSTRQIKNLRIDGDEVNFDVELGYPAKSQIDGLRKSLIAAARTVGGVGNVSVNLSTRVIAHAVQRGVQLLPNVKNIVAMDSFGNLPNMNAAEVAIRLPGVAGNLSDENLVDGFTIRGIGPGLNTVTLDGSPLTSQGALNRATNMNNLTGSMFDQMELTKGHMPDKEAGSIGGTINLKSRSPLSMSEPQETVGRDEGNPLPAVPVKTGDDGDAPSLRMNPSMLGDPDACVGRHHGK
jgi:metal-sulfur cluster biosynthetic enzyme